MSELSSQRPRTGPLMAFDGFKSTYRSFPENIPGKSPGANKTNRETEIVFQAGLSLITPFPLLSSFLYPASVQAAWVKLARAKPSTISQAFPATYSIIQLAIHLLRLPNARNSSSVGNEDLPSTKILSLLSRTEPRSSSRIISEVKSNLDLSSIKSKRKTGAFCAENAVNKYGFLQPIHMLRSLNRSTEKWHVPFHVAMSTDVFRNCRAAEQSNYNLTKLARKAWGKWILSFKPSWSNSKLKIWVSEFILRLCISNINFTALYSISILSNNLKSLETILKG